MSGRVDVGTVRPPLERLPVESPAAHVREEHAADAAQDAERREHRLDEGEAELGVQKSDFEPRNSRYSYPRISELPPKYMKSGASPQLLKPGRAARAVPSRQCAGSSAASTSAVWRPSVSPIVRRDLVGQPHRVARQRTELAEDGRFLDEVDAERDVGAGAEELLAELLLLDTPRTPPAGRGR